MCFSAKSFALSAQGTHMSPLQIPPFAGISRVVSNALAAAPALMSYFLTSTVIDVLLTISLMFVTPPAIAAPASRVASIAVDIIFVSIDFVPYVICRLAPVVAGGAACAGFAYVAPRKL